MGEKGVVLVVEDNEDILMSAKYVLEREKHTVHTATTLAEARRVLAEHPPDVILLDVNLPDGDEIDFCGEIRGQTGAHIYFCSANSRRDVVLRGLESGGDGYIKKPCDMDVLCAQVEAALRRRRRAVT